MVTAAMIAVAQGQDSAGVERFDVILRRSPFSSDAPAAEAPAAKLAEPVDVFKHIRMCAMTFDGETLCVGLIDSAVQPPRSYLLAVGESQDGLLLVQADYERESALLRRGADEAWVHLMPDGIAEISERPAREAAAQAMARAQRIVARREAVRQQLEATEARERDAMTTEQKLRQAQMERLRRGAEPLPIPLTRAMDDQLVIEGVLPPQPDQTADPED